MERLNLLEATATDIQKLYKSHNLTCQHLVQLCLDQIAKYDHYLHALISIAPKDLLLNRAKLLDDERSSGKACGPLHGIPIVLKDVILTSRELGTPTTAGSHVLQHTSSSRNAPIVDKLLAAGMIIIGKANLSETWGPKGLPHMLPGWSAVGGQTQSAYVKGGLDPNDVVLGNSSPLGSSSGSAVAVSAGYAPLGIGEETSGSLVAPANRAGLYSFKPCPGSVDMTGVYPISKTFDTLGPMAKCPEDLKNLLNVISPTKLLTNSKQYPLRLGFIDASTAWFPEIYCRNDEGSNQQMEAEYAAAIEKLRGLGLEVQHPIRLPAVESLLAHGADWIHYIAFREAAAGVREYLSLLGQSEVRCMQDIIDWNISHADLALPKGTNQDDLTRCVELESRPPEDLIAARASAKRVGATDGLDKVFEEYNIDLIVAPGDGGTYCYAAAAGYSMATAPVGRLEYNGRPFGICLIAKAGHEDLLMSFLEMYHELYPNRPLPDLQY